MLDADGSGEIAANEVAAALIACGIKVQEKMLEEMFALIGKGVGDELTFADFAEMMTTDESGGFIGKAVDGDSGEEKQVSMTFALMIIAFRRQKFAFFNF